MKNIISTPLLICSLVFLSSCGESGENAVTDDTPKTETTENLQTQSVNDSELVLECRMLDGDNLTDIFFDRDLTQSFAYKVLKSDEKEIVFKYNNRTEGRFQFDRESKILTESESEGAPRKPYAVCNNSQVVGRQILESDKNLSWEIRGQYVKPECLIKNSLYPLPSFDNYQEYYARYFGIEEVDVFEDKEFTKFYRQIGLYLNKDVPLNDSFNPSWSAKELLSLTLNLTDCLEENPVSRIHVEKSTIFLSQLENIELEDAKVLAPHIDSQFMSVKKITVNDHSDDGYRTSVTATFGVVELDGELFMVPLRTGVMGN